MTGVHFKIVKLIAFFEISVVVVGVVVGFVSSSSSAEP